ncbi:MAG: LysM peptidoglycan-binding domain-containing protein [Spirochaetales bacterium]|nr:LysM peptidoglycan-binding domain-containing protein [Spirochaetales bacterium]
MRKIYAFLLAGASVFAFSQGRLDAQEQQAGSGNLSFINFIEGAENKAAFSPIRLEPKIDMLITKAQAEPAKAEQQGSDAQAESVENAATPKTENAQAQAVQAQPQAETAQNKDASSAAQTANPTAESSAANQDSPQTAQAQNTTEATEQPTKPQKQKKHKLGRKAETAEAAAQNAETAQAESSAPEAEAAEQPLEPPAPAKQHIAIDYPEENALVQKFLKQYSTDYAKKWLNAVMKNGAPYRGYIRAKIAEMGLPECLEFLPVIESNFKIDAVSKSGAMGMWQFMKNSISPFGIRVIKDYMDERCDPWLTTDAALKKLKENYDTLGDWNLALAAYNSGLGAVSRACKKNPGADYWTLSEKKQLKSESINYVPKFLAIADILTNPEYYGIEVVEFDENAHLDYTLIDVKRNVDITLVAEQTSMDSEIIKFLNPALFLGVTPPNAVYKLRVPAEYKDAVTELINDKDKLLIKYHLYKIRSGDTVYALSRHYGVSEDMILQANPGLKPSQLKIGKTIRIPAFKDVSPYKGKSANENVAYTGTYKVQQGDNLWGISLKYNVQVESLAEANNMQVDAILREGSTLKVPIIE